LVSGLWLLAACSNGTTNVPPAKTVATAGVENTQSSQHGASCKKDANCPSGQRCGFTGAMGCEGSGTCVVEKAGGNCFDPGGRCGCDGQPVDLFCAVGSSTEFASAPVGFVGGCPKPCTRMQSVHPETTCHSSFVEKASVSSRRTAGSPIEVPSALGVMQTRGKLKGKFKTSCQKRLAPGRHG
jgi:hypothetical protein